MQTADNVAKRGKYLLSLWLIFSSFALYAEEQTASQTDSPIRLAVVNTPHSSGLLEYLLADFEAKTGLHVSVLSSDAPFTLARGGQADLLIAHYGKSGMAEFVSEGYGSWPEMVFANQAVLIGPTDDPAGVTQTRSLTEAFQAIAATGHTLLANNISGITQLAQTTALAAKLSIEDDWYRDNGHSKGQAMNAADMAGAYVIWGATPFLKFNDKHQTSLNILFSDDPNLQRIMALSRISTTQFPENNHQGAKALADFLLSNETQAKIMQFRVKGSQRQLWWPAARHN
jgi:tungstate transport system substrate-binding protein